MDKMLAMFDLWYLPCILTLYYVTGRCGVQ